MVKKTCSLPLNSLHADRRNMLHMSTYKHQKKICRIVCSRFIACYMCKTMQVHQFYLRDQLTDIYCVSQTVYLKNFSNLAYVGDVGGLMHLSPTFAQPESWAKTSVNTYTRPTAVPTFQQFSTFSSAVSIHKPVNHCMNFG